ncbi:MAG: hypothetical protein LUH11_02965 [Candidatus Gastranaerophilales bacterium]|nr:hypothetical protein [Candidatus Gastranaerophilales bacterium]
MAEIEVILPVQDDSHSVEYISFDATTLETENIIVDAFKNKNNSLHILVNAESAGNITFVKGNNYPNSMLGDLTLELAAGLNDFIIEDLSRFENRDGSICINTSTSGTIYAIAKRAGLDKS